MGMIVRCGSEGAEPQPIQSDMEQERNAPTQMLAIWQHVETADSLKPVNFNSQIANNGANKCSPRERTAEGADFKPQRM